jgi:transposase
MLSLGSRASPCGEHLLNLAVHHRSCFGAVTAARQKLIVPRMPVPHMRPSSTLEQIHEVLREETRVKQGRKKTPTAAVLDTQSVKTAGKRGTPTATTRAIRSQVVSATTS